MCNKCANNSLELLLIQQLHFNFNLPLHNNNLQQKNHSRLNDTVYRLVQKLF